VCIERLFKMGKLCLHCCHLTIWIVMLPFQDDHVSPKTRGILSIVCTSRLLDIHGLKYDSDTFYLSMTILIQIFFFFKILTNI